MIHQTRPLSSNHPQFSLDNLEPISCVVGGGVQLAWGPYTEGCDEVCAVTHYTVSSPWVVYILLCALHLQHHLVDRRAHCSRLGVFIM